MIEALLILSLVRFTAKHRRFINYTYEAVLMIPFGHSLCRTVQANTPNCIFLSTMVFFKRAYLYTNEQFFNENFFFYEFSTEKFANSNSSLLKSSNEKFIVIKIVLDIFFYFHVYVRAIARTWQYRTVLPWFERLTGS